MSQYIIISLVALSFLWFLFEFNQIFKTEEKGNIKIVPIEGKEPLQNAKSKQLNINQGHSINEPIFIPKKHTVESYRSQQKRGKKNKLIKSK